MIMSAKVKDVMTINVIAVTKNTPFKEMAARLGEHRQNAFPVLDDDGTVIGVVSQTDLLARIAAGLTAGDLMTRPPVTVGPSDLASHAGRLMHARRVRQLPVVDETGHLAGLLSRAGVLNIYGRPDEDIRSQIIGTVLRDELTADPGGFTVTVKDGIVTLEGRPESVQIGLRIVAEAEQVDAVVAIRDRLTYRAVERGGTIGAGICQGRTSSPK